MDVAAWLRGLGLEQYAPAFRANDVDGEVLPELTVDSRIQCCRHDRGVDDAQALNAVDPQLRIDDCARLGTHATGAARMEECGGSGADIRLDRRLVVGDRSGSELFFDQVAYRRRPHHVAHSLYRPRERMQVLRLAEIFRENQRMRCRIGVAQQDMAAAERSAVSQQTFGS